MSNKKWFSAREHTGWSKTQKATTRRAKLLRATDKRKTKHNQYLEAARKIQALANVTEDKRTAELAKSDADYFFAKARKTK